MIAFAFAAALAFLPSPAGAQSVCAPGTYAAADGDFVVLAPVPSIPAPGLRYLFRDGRRGATSEAAACARREWSGDLLTPSSRLSSRIEHVQNWRRYHARPHTSGSARSSQGCAMGLKAMSKNLQRPERCCAGRFCAALRTDRPKDFVVDGSVEKAEGEEEQRSHRLEILLP